MFVFVTITIEHCIYCSLPVCSRPSVTCWPAAVVGRPTSTAPPSVPRSRGAATIGSSRLSLSQSELGEGEHIVRAILCPLKHQNPPYLLYILVEKHCSSSIRIKIQFVNCVLLLQYDTIATIGQMKIMSITHRFLAFTNLRCLSSQAWQHARSIVSCWCVCVFSL